MVKKAKILSVSITQGGRDSVLEEVGKLLHQTENTSYIVTPNPEIIVEARKNPRFKIALDNAELSLADGIGVVFAAKLLGIEAITRIPGVELVDILCKEATDPHSKWSKKPVKIGFLGGRGGVAERTADCLQKKYPKLNIVYVDEEWGPHGFEKAEKFQKSLGQSVDNSLHKKNGRSQDTKHNKQNTDAIDILFVAFGSPKQEIWMYENQNEIPAKLMVGVGGAFNMISGKVKRAPKIFSDMGLEWLYRLVQEPWRIKRQIALPIFLGHLIQEKFSRT